MSLIGQVSRIADGLGRTGLNHAVRVGGSMIVCLFIGCLAFPALIANGAAALTYDTRAGVVTSCAGLDTRGATCVVRFDHDGGPGVGTVAAGFVQPHPGQRVTLRVSADGSEVLLAGREEIFGILASAVATLISIGGFWSAAVEAQRASRAGLPAE